MTKSFKKAVWATAIVVPGFFVAQAANAQFVETWDFQVDSTFAEFAPDGGGSLGAVTGSAPNGELGGNTVLSWGATDPQSSIEVTSDVDGGGLQTNGPAVPGAVFTHNNNDIQDPSDVSLESFVLTTQIMLTSDQTDPPGFGGQTETPPSISFNSRFIETQNQEPCLDTSESVCDDIFTLTEGPTNPQSTFTMDDVEYTVFLDILDLGPLTDAECSEAGSVPGCIGFTTQEGQANEFRTEFRIVAEQPAEAVPEPGTLALLGLGLVGLGFARRRA